MDRPSLPSRRAVAFGGVSLVAALGVRPGVSRGAPSEPTKTKVAFIGDSMADGLWGGFVRLVGQDKCFKEHLDGGRYARNGTGLTRPDSYDWPAQARRIAESYGPSAFVMSIGLNDRQDVIEHATGRTTFGTPQWEEAYRTRVTALLKAGAEDKAAVLLVGLPILRDATSNRDAQANNKIFAEAVAALNLPHVSYIEPWQPSGAAPAAYTSVAPSQNGRLIQARAPDGIHFTAAGYDLVTAYLFPQVVAHLKNAGHDVGAACTGS